jgi:hypothetical protein
MSQLTLKVTETRKKSKITDGLDIADLELVPLTTAVSSNPPFFLRVFNLNLSLVCSHKHDDEFEAARRGK